MFKIKSLEHFFKPEVRNRGEVYYDEDSVYLLQATDTDIAGVIKATPPVRVKLTSQSVSDATFTVDCSCTSSQKGQLCKHIWGTILTAALDYPDFFESKTDLIKADAAKLTKPKHEELKAKQSAYRKEQYRKLKSEKKAKKASSSHRPAYNDEAEAAIKYFSENGFELERPINIEVLQSAKKLLSRVFHPDKGGSHAEALQLNKHFDVLLSVIRRS